MYTIEIEAVTEFTPEVLTLLGSIYDAIPEFEQPYSNQEISSRLLATPSLLLLAKIEGEIAGFKLGYQMTDEVFYSWLGGVSPDYRGLGLAKSLLEYQERWTREQGYSRIDVKTRNCFPVMLKMLINNHYQITAMTADCQHLSQNKLHLQKLV
ncbi:GNAT family N-acetyltransferase [Shewanella sp. KX20019]|uniref:GNAT family N-acetyltransferase n=1 Tax=Shewanella sp. KX20019 TaxID=2803864 RepID=UPI001926EDE1|nr:GNAT family N-acetyltransferase [Shewanella sp. KX20019]QQX80442.1 GNAT family N-acetyltransferase [Shewanella sp. KX20019]